LSGGCANGNTGRKEYDMKLEEKVCYVYERKCGRQYVEDYRDEDAASVYRGLARCLVAKKLDECRWIKRIVKANRCDGWVTVIIYEEFGRRVYTVKA
jgi:hypothetical protein